VAGVCEPRLLRTVEADEQRDVRTTYRDGTFVNRSADGSSTVTRPNPDGTLHVVIRGVNGDVFDEFDERIVDGSPERIDPANRPEYWRNSRPTQ
jgi:hypothetical protein